MIGNPCHPDVPGGLTHAVAGEPAPTRQAFDMKELHTTLADFSAGELKQIRVLCAGSQLEAGSKYLKLSEHYRQEIQARGDEEVGPNDLYIPKRDTPFELWNRLLGIENPDRTKQPAGQS